MPLVSGGFLGMQCRQYLLSMSWSISAILYLLPCMTGPPVPGAPWAAVAVPAGLGRFPLSMPGLGWSLQGVKGKSPRDDFVPCGCSGVGPVSGSPGEWAGFNWERCQGREGVGLEFLECWPENSKGRVRGWQFSSIKCRRTQREIQSELEDTFLSGSRGRFNRVKCNPVNIALFLCVLSNQV